MRSNAVWCIRPSRLSHSLNQMCSCELRWNWTLTQFGSLESTPGRWQCWWKWSGNWQAAWLAYPPFGLSPQLKVVRKFVADLRPKPRDHRNSTLVFFWCGSRSRISVGLYLWHMYVKATLTGKVFATKGTIRLQQSSKHQRSAGFVASLCWHWSDPMLALHQQCFCFHAQQLCYVPSTYGSEDPYVFRLEKCFPQAEQSDCVSDITSPVSWFCWDIACHQTPV